MSKYQISKKQARVILEIYLVEKAKAEATKLVIEDKQTSDWIGLNNPDDLKDCFFVHAQEDTDSYTGVSHMIAISKKTGEIIADCGNPTKKYSLFFS